MGCFAFNGSRPDSSLKGFTLMSLIEETNHSHLYLAKTEEDKSFVVLKFIKPKCDIESNEIEIMEKINSPYVMKSIGKFEHNEMQCAVLPYARFGDLQAFITKTPLPSIQQAQSILRDLLKGIECLHSNGIIHGDIKPENVLIMDSFSVCLADLGAATFLKAGEKLNELRGTLAYSAPEVILGSYSHEADMWSVGVIAFILLTGRFPFDFRSVESLGKSILMANYSFTASDMKRIPDAAVSFVRNLIIVEPSARLTASEALSHPFIASM